MRFPINHDYTDAQRLEACEAIFSAQHDDAYISVLTDYWHIFAACSIGHGLAPWQEYLLLRQFAFEWFTNYRIDALINDVKHLTPNPADFSDDES